MLCVSKGLNIYVDFDDTYFDWFQLASDGSILALSSVSIIKQNSKLEVRYQTGMIDTIMHALYDC